MITCLYCRKQPAEPDRSFCAPCWAGPLAGGSVPFVVRCDFGKPPVYRTKQPVRAGAVRAQEAQESLLFRVGGEPLVRIQEREVARAVLHRPPAPPRPTHHR